MRTISHLARLIVFVCLAAFLLAAIAHPGELLPVAILAPYWIFLAIIVGRPIRSRNQVLVLLPFPVLSVLSPRPPPVA